MPRVDSSFSKELSELPTKELVKLLVKAASQDKPFHDYLLVNYVDPIDGEKILFDETLEEIDILQGKYYRGNTEEASAAKMLIACHKRANQFAKICKTKTLELDLILKILDYAFELPYRLINGYFPSFQKQVHLLLKKTVLLVDQKIHEDYRLEYVPKVNRYLTIFHKYKSYAYSNDPKLKLPESLD